MKKLILVEDQPIYVIPYERELAVLGPHFGWQHVATFDNAEEAAEYVAEPRNKISGVITDMRILRRRYDANSPDLASSTVYGLELVKGIAKAGLTSVKVVGLTAFLYQGGPVKIAVEEVMSAYDELITVFPKSIEPEEDIEKALRHLSA